MSRYIQKNKRSLGGLILPLFFLLALGVLSVGAFPGWIKPVYSLPGDLCDTGAPCDSGPLATACNVCNGEFCAFNQVADQFQCAIDNGAGPNFDPAATPNPACPLGDPTQPGCWTTCEEILNINGNPGFCETPSCSPNDSFCDGISGGRPGDSNECRAGVCLPFSTPDPENPSGCDYTLTPDASLDCRNCIPEGLATLENCGNGICEPDEGEGCETCSIDCRTPGYDGTCLVIPDDQAQLDAICVDPPAIIFPGPPYPNGGQFPGQVCEDGNLCTTNVCNTSGTCDVTELGCEPDADFCCPAGCAAPTGSSCREVTGAPIPGCDPDCYVPEQCVPTPSPTPPPVFAGCLQGSGGWGEKDGPGCDGFACSLNTAPSVPSHGMALALLASLGAAAFLTFRKRHG